MTVKVRAPGKFQFFDSNGNPASGYKVYTYVPGTTTAKDTYTDYTGTVANSNPVVLDSRGEADIWWSGTYKIKITDASDVEIYTVDEYGSGEDFTLTGNYNKIKNGGFETDTDGDGVPDNWTITAYDATSTTALDTTDQIEGLSSYKFVSTGLGGGYADTDFFEVQEAEVQTIVFSLKSSVVDVRNTVDIIWYTAAQASISTTNLFDESAANPTSWTQYIYDATPPTNARYAKVRVTGCHQSDATAGTTRFDDVRCISINAVIDNHVIAATTTASGIAELATDAEVQAGTDTTRIVTPASLATIIPYVSTPTGYGKTTNLFSKDSPSLLDLQANLTQNTVTTVGPTGSGATYIWTQLDDIPLSANAILLRMYIIAVHSVGSVHKYQIIQITPNNSHSPAGSILRIAHYTNASEVYTDMEQCVVSLDSANIFNALWDKDAAWDTGDSSYINVEGYWI